MLHAEQYFLIYLIGIFITTTRDARVLCCFAVAAFIANEVFYRLLKGSPQEFIIVGYGFEFILFLFTSQFIKSFWIRNLVILSYSLTLISPAFLLILPHLLMRDDAVTDWLFYVSRFTGYIINEIFISILLLLEKDKSSKRIVYFTGFILLNYILLIYINIKN